MTTETVVDRRVKDRRGMGRPVGMFEAMVELVFDRRNDGPVFGRRESDRRA